MPAGPVVPTLGIMPDIRQLDWRLAAGLGALALVRPVMSITGLLDILGKPLAPILVTVAISLVWIAVVGFSRVSRPILTLVLAGLAYGVFSIVLSAVLSPILTGELQGPLTNPFAVISVLLTNVIWGAATGVLAALVQRLRPAPARESRP